MTPENFAQHRRNLAAVERASAEVRKTTDNLCSLAVSCAAKLAPGEESRVVARATELGERLVEDLRVETEAKRRLAEHWKSAP